jgi:hypothetical protein
MVAPDADRRSDQRKLTMGPFSLLIFFAAMASILWTRRSAGNFTFVSLMPFQKGVLYRKGLPVREVGPGRHGVWAGREKIIFLDVRPTTVSFENRAVTLRDGYTAVYGLTGSAEVRDVRKAIYASNNPNHLVAFALLIAARSVLSGYASETLKLKKDAVTAEISQRARTRLSAAGIELLNFRFTQVGIAPPPLATPASVSPK